VGGLAWDAAIRWPPSPGLSHGGGKPNAVWYAVAHRERSERKEAREAGETQDDGPKQVAHIGCGLRGSLQRFGEFLGWCHPVEGLSRASVELVCGEVEILLGECCHVGSFGEVLA